MSDKKYIDLGQVTAYAYAVEHGYTGTEEEFAIEQAQFAQNAQQVAEDRVVVRADRVHVDEVAEAFTGTTAPEAVQRVTTEGDTQVTRVQAEGDTQVDNVQAEGATQVQAVEDKGEEVLESIPENYEDKIDEVNDYLTNVIKVSDEQPESEVNKLWIKDQVGQGYEVPLYSEFEELADEVQKKTSIDLGVSNASVGDRIYVRSIDPEGRPTGWTTSEHVNYGFHIDSNESDPSEAVTYIADAVGMTPAHMDYENDVFDYGSWKNAFFMPRPCMLKYDGTVDYYLDPNDYSKRENGAPSDVADDTYGGNAMMEWGRDGKIIWYKVDPDEDDNTSASIYFSDEKLDDGYHAWSFINNQGKLVDHFYTPIYNGTIDGDGRLRSISGKANTDLCQNKTATEEIAAAELNNPGEEKIWYTEVFSDITLINLLLVLISKCLDTQSAFGDGACTIGADADSIVGTGTANNKGLFFGSNNKHDAVKVFGMENYWANVFRRISGLMSVNGVIKYKMTRGTEDGSTASDYNNTGNNYLESGSSFEKNAGGWAKKCMFIDSGGMFLSETKGSKQTYYADYDQLLISGSNYALYGGSCASDSYCGAFCFFYNATASTARWNVGASLSCKPLFKETPKVYGFHIDSNESDPSEAVKYLEDAVGMKPAHMNYFTGKFDYGDWENAFFMPRPCMLKYDGTVDYYLDPNDYSKKEDGTPSDVADFEYGGNAMMEWGRDGKKIWYKVVPEGEDNTSASIYFSDYQLDEGFHAWSFINNQGNLVDHFYTPIYNGTIDGDGKLRSISGKANTELCQGKTAQQEIDAAELNNPGEDKLWYTETFSDCTLINLLLVLMGKCLDTQLAFGNGASYTGSAAEFMIGTGTMDDRGLFFGLNDEVTGVKVFGMENYWANQYRRIAGIILDNRTIKYKMTGGINDGSSATNYNTTGENYIDSGIGFSTNTGSYIAKHAFSEDGGVFFSEFAGSNKTYYADCGYVYEGTNYAYRGGNCSLGSRGGAFCLNTINPATHAYWNIGASISCKPRS